MIYSGNLKNARVQPNTKHLTQQLTTKHLFQDPRRSDNVIKAGSFDLRQPTLENTREEEDDEIAADTARRGKLPKINKKWKI